MFGLESNNITFGIMFPSMNYYMQKSTQNSSFGFLDCVILYVIRGHLRCHLNLGVGDV